MSILPPAVPRIYIRSGPIDISSPVSRGPRFTRVHLTLLFMWIRLSAVTCIAAQIHRLLEQNSVSEPSELQYRQQYCSAVCGVADALVYIDTRGRGRSATRDCG